MGNWYDAHGTGEWVRRSFSFLNLGVLVFTLVLVVAEFRFDWCETLVGRFLLTTNQKRPETGSVWETGRHTVNARRFIDDLILEKENVEQNVGSARSFAALARGLGEGQWVNVDKERFKRLYLSLGSQAQKTLIQPARLVWLLNGNRTSRIFCEGRPGGINIYFIDAGNRVIRQLDLDDRILADLPGAGDVMGSLDTFETFAGTIYEASRFFDAVFKLPPEMTADLIPDGARLLSAAGTLNRVGIWNEAEQGYIRLGFEFRRMDIPRVVVIQAREWAVWQLNLILKEDTP